MPRSFRVITPKMPKTLLILVVDLIDRDMGEWRENRIDHLFLPVDAKTIQAIPLYTAWPTD